MAFILNEGSGPRGDASSLLFARQGHLPGDVAVPARLKVKEVPQARGYISGTVIITGDVDQWRLPGKLLLIILQQVPPKR